MEWKHTYFVMCSHKLLVGKFRRRGTRKKWENAYLTLKNARASRAHPPMFAPSLALEPRAGGTHLGEKNSGAPLDQILDPLLKVKQNLS